MTCQNALATGSTKRLMFRCKNKGLGTDQRTWKSAAQWLSCLRAIPKRNSSMLRRNKLTSSIESDWHGFVLSGFQLFCLFLNFSELGMIEHALDLSPQSLKSSPPPKKRSAILLTWNLNQPKGWIWSGIRYYIDVSKYKCPTSCGLDTNCLASDYPWVHECPPTTLVSEVLHRTEGSQFQKA